VIDMRFSLIGAAVALAMVASVAPSAGADGAATPVTTGCPAGFAHVSVTSLPNPPYRLPARLDAAGNANGYICAFPLPEAVAEAYCKNLEPSACYLVQVGLPLYQFRDDNNPADGAGAAVLDFGS
jgi:hypothetical protein